MFLDISFTLAEALFFIHCDIVCHRITEFNVHLDSSLLSQINLFTIEEIRDAPNATDSNEIVFYAKSMVLYLTSQIMRARIFPKKSCVTFDVLHTNINVLSMQIYV